MRFLRQGLGALPISMQRFPGDGWKQPRNVGFPACVAQRVGDRKNGHAIDPTPTVAERGAVGGAAKVVSAHPEISELIEIIGQHSGGHMEG